MLYTLLFIILAYLLGSIPFGKIIGFHHGIDIQKSGSGNIGFANCLRVLGWKPAIIVLLGDVLKGFLPVYFSLSLLPGQGATFVALSAVVGHVFPIWLKFKGGKGIATGLGVLLALNTPLAITSILIWIIFLSFTRLNSLASISMICCLPILTAFIAQQLLSLSLVLLMIGMWTHRKNIYNLLNHREKRLF
ncbi:MAG: acyl-phosphate glycerol 3-phosphate acyltransferase [Candidatus Wildermuthbacteria bacterium RIFCSPLOWO2_12_FULL_40_9]|uniref:Glycerol-3-phosphate acyltransferase n=2 Tax=Candidatus Wildermuthiibacteriota TaxID=1817923 RepID=A0A1G2RET0_9BACT|nr:MAG: acyl-phosphate glycerol 3-phosphate acyltransferase [Candidatus Wildermuthbacteria bacterium RIFCSPHIGHO2_12_FULL_40_12]OHA77077.1 MAG: acyl-phosphate glycerol 3-phosphate acyltransferase [Candidatus Wildermuthbacteria bacterium RIFCSPLOWO2_12_FULL_40_9]